MFIEQPAKWLRWLYPKAIWRMDKKDHSVYLTFDDGPIPESTPFILETLRKYNIKATFFMVGENVLRHHDLYNQIVAEGHQVGNHTFNHIGAFKHRVISYVLNTNKANDIIHARLIFIEAVVAPVAERSDIRHDYVGTDFQRFFPSLRVDCL